MKPEDLISSKEYSFKSQRCRLLINGATLGVTGVMERTGGDVFNLLTKDKSYRFSLDSSDRDIIMDLINRGFKNICSVSSITDKNDPLVFFLDIKFFSVKVQMGDLNIYISEQVKDSLIKKKLIKKEKADTKEFFSEFADTFMLNDGTYDCFAFNDGVYPLPETVVDTAKKDELVCDSENVSEGEASAKTAGVVFDENAEQEELPVSAENEDAVKENSGEDGNKAQENADIKGEKKQRSIIIYGKNCAIYVRADGSEENTHLIAEKVTFARNNMPCMKLGYGRIMFNSEKAFISETVKAMLKESPGYINLWNQYANLEGEFLLRRARKIGLLKYTGAPCFENGNVTLFFDFDKNNPLSELSLGDRLNHGWVPAYLSNDEMTWSEYNELPNEVKRGSRDYDSYALSLDDDDEEAPVRDKERTEQQRAAKIVGITPKSITLEWRNSNILPMQPLSMSIIGDEMQINRRRKARERIENGECANPQLGLIIDGKAADGIGADQKAKKILPLSEYVYRKMFPKYHPTENQISAIDIALNTPDIAIIQGPPGTGKTTVIKAIIERLNEISKKKDFKPGCALVTSMQHDAVYNISKELEINGMATIKFGERQRTGEDVIEEWDRDSVEWCRKVSNDIREKNPQLKKSENENELRSRFNSYLSYPSDDKAKELLEYCLALPISNEQAEAARSLMSSFDNVGNSIDDVLTAVRRLRVKKAGFEDDGPENASSLYYILTENDNFDKNDEENRDILSVLRRAVSAESADKALLKDTVRIRNILLSRLLPPPHYDVPTVRDDIVSYVQEVIDSLGNATGRLDEVLRELIDELERNPEASKSAVQSYNYVFAATAQQSMGKDILAAKNVSLRDKEFPCYETVIVDEAARVTPTDLMIPLAQAKRRIILVGDHRQLPHIYDEDIFEEMQNNGEIENENDITISMFQHLLNSAKALENADGVCRTITLSNQFRAHPLIGQFVSDNFYPPEEKFNSPLSAENFVQPISDKPLIWVDIPYSNGGENRSSETHSRFRNAEADYIAEKLGEYIKREDCKELKFGVITFYREQVSVLRKKLGSIADDPRVKIGSVDAFQGMEFDVVFLSVVRTSAKRVENDDLDELSVEADENENLVLSQTVKEKIGMKYYGFLVSSNRLCVALSRQKKLLIVVGDKDIFMRNSYETLAKHCVPAMQNLYKLAEREGEIINV